MKIYQPTPEEINTIIQAGIAKHPQLTTRYRRAASLLMHRALHRNVGWLCDSQADPDQAYAVDSYGCTCNDFVIGGGKANHRVYCKHRLAFFAYREILIGHINQRLAGNMRFSGERRRAAQWPATLLILDTQQRPRLLSYVDGHSFPSAICNVRLDKQGRQTPATDKDLAHFAHWLADAHPAPQSETVALIDDPALAGARAQVVAQATNIEQIEAIDSAMHPPW